MKRFVAQITIDKIVYKCGGKLTGSSGVPIEDVQMCKIKCTLVKIMNDVMYGKEMSIR